MNLRSLLASTLAGLMLTITSARAEITQDQAGLARKVIQEKEIELAKAIGFLEGLETHVKSAQGAVRKAERGRNWSYVYAGIPAVALTSITLYLGNAFFKAKGQGGDYNFSPLIGIAALISGAGATGTSLVVYLKYNEVQRLKKLLDELQNNITAAKKDIEIKKQTLDLLKRSLPQN